MEIFFDRYRVSRGEHPKIQALGFGIFLYPSQRSQTWSNLWDRSTSPHMKTSLAGGGSGDISWCFVRLAASFGLMRPCQAHGRLGTLRPKHRAAYAGVPPCQHHLANNFHDITSRSGQFSNHSYHPTYDRTLLNDNMASNSFRNQVDSLGWSRREAPASTSTPFLSKLQSFNPFGSQGYVRLPTTNQDIPAQLPAQTRQEEDAGWFARSSSR